MMTESIGQQILVVSGDYEVLNRTRTALADSDFVIRAAFSHRDALYTMEFEAIDLVLVDAGMFDRLTGAYTMSALEQFETVPMILYAREGIPTKYAQPPFEIVIGGLDKRTLHVSIQSILEFSPPTESLQIQPTHNGEIQTLLSLSQSLTEVLDQTEVLNRIVEAARHLTGAEEGMILLPDDEAGQLYLRARVGIDDDVAHNFRIKTEDTLAGQVFNSGGSVLIGAQGPQKVKTQYFVNSLLYVPILLKGHPIGVLGVNNATSTDEFDERHRSLLLNLASYAAIAIENARTHEETLERARELQSLVEASQVVNASVALFETLPNICEQLVRVLNVSWSSILEWDHERDQLRTLARYQRMCWRPGQGPVVDLPTLNDLDSRDYVQISRDDPTELAAMDDLIALGIHSLILIPIRVDGELLGMVRAFYIDAPDSMLIAKVIQRVQHLGLESLMTVANSDSQVAPPQAMRALEEVKQHLGANWCELALRSSDGRSMMSQVAVGEAVWLKEPYPSMRLSDYPELSAAVQGQAPIKQQLRGERHQSTQRLLEATRSHSLLGVPLVQRGQAQGLVLFGDTWYTRVFSERDVDLGRTIVGQAATALENARLVHDLEYSLQELKDTQARLIQTARLSAMGELSAAVAHQINNPLTTILVDTELMLLDEREDSRNYRSLQAISRAGKRAASVVRRLLATARPSEENAPIEPIDVVDTIEGVLSLVRPHIEQDHIQVIPRLPQQELPPVWTGQGQLDDIWLNLLLNAHDALIGCDDARIGIEVDYQPGRGYLDVIVWDNGPGIPEALRAEIFQPFFTTKPVGEGTGLGLHICKQVIERINGHISVESFEGEGTRFLVRLPVKKGDE